MSAIDADVERLTEPLRRTSSKFYVALAVTAILSLATAVAYVSQLRFGMAVTGLRGWGTQGGVPWGLYIGTFIWWIGIAHGGVAISAAVRLFDFEEYLPIARIAEILTLIALPMAATNILFDIGRPDTLWVMITNWPTTVQTSPLTWDMTATFLYFIMAGTYLIITLRTDLHDCLQRGTLPSALNPLYKLLLIGYRPSEREKSAQMAWWMAIGILLLVPLMSGGVVPWLFATMGMHPGWFGASHGPAMFAESMTSAIAAVVITAAAFRWAYGWDDVIGDEIFRGLNKALIALVLVTLWFLLQSLVTGSYPAAPAETGALTQSLVAGRMAVPFWLAVGGLLVALAYLVAQALRPSLYSVAASAVAAFLVTSAILLKKIVFVVEGLLYPTRDPLAGMFPENSYWPTIPEFTMAFGTIAVAVLIFLVATKIIPIVELEHASPAPDEAAESDAEVTEA
ncbi:NrfD/PsrC family molybdoenzyme membrane anchor subunit [Natronobeatus ordinarius]|uniref:NrfD/PsrC family molybdoenzyme membrane anchor subunit n=1 Tax=Natronobeatus ordinarius TaxID=2963433 RepID=UPI0020CF2F12|nr:NrfD/PsrC family molybdoenzyme membrane anchor subunit [Natronobeatus ordinarius]